MRVWYVALCALAALTLIACGPTAVNGLRAASPATLATLPPATPKPTANPSVAIGTSVPTTGGDAITVLRTAPAQSNNEFETPPPGGTFLAAEIKECAGNGVLLVEPPEWSVKLADATQIDASIVVDASPNPELQATDLNPGSCTDGWVYFPLPAGANPIEIHLLRANFYWTLQ